MEINKAGQGRDKDRVMAILYTSMKRHLCEEVPFEKRPRLSEGVSPAKLRQQSVSEGGKNS